MNQRNKLCWKRTNQTFDSCQNLGGFDGSFTLLLVLVLLVFFDPYKKFNCINKKSLRINSSWLENSIYLMSYTTRRRSFSLLRRFFQGALIVIITIFIISLMMNFERDSWNLKSKTLKHLVRIVSSPLIWQNTKFTIYLFSLDFYTFFWQSSFWIVRAISKVNFSKGCFSRRRSIFKFLHGRKW